MLPGSNLLCSLYSPGSWGRWGRSSAGPPSAAGSPPDQKTTPPPPQGFLLMRCPLPPTYIQRMIDINIMETNFFFHHSMTAPAWEWGQSRASAPGHGWGRPPPRAWPGARSPRPPQSPGGDRIIKDGKEGFQRGTFWLLTFNFQLLASKASPHTLRVLEASNSLHHGQRLHHGQYQSFSY